MKTAQINISAPVRFEAGEHLNGATLAAALQTLVVAGTLECPTMDAFVPL